MATTPLGDCKGGCWHTPKKFPVGHVEHGATQGDRGRSGEPSRRPGLRRGPEWRKVTEAEEAPWFAADRVSCWTQVLKCPPPSKLEQH